jgi:hypothetical protein
MLLAVKRQRMFGRFSAGIAARCNDCHLHQMAKVLDAGNPCRMMLIARLN